MKITAKKYAESLLDVSEGKSKAEATKQVESLLRIMHENGDMKKTSIMIEHFVNLWNEKNSTSVVEVCTATEADKKTKKTLKAYIQKKLNAENVEMKLNIDKSILGGVIIKEGDRVFDGSVRTRLYELKNKLVK